MRFVFVLDEVVNVRSTSQRIEWDPFALYVDKAWTPLMETVCGTLILVGGTPLGHALQVGGTLIPEKSVTIFHYFENTCF